MPAILKTPEQIDRMRVAGRVVARALEAMRRAAVPGATTLDIERAAIAVIEGAGATSAFLAYAPHGMPPYPGWTCISVNEEVVHGIAGSRTLAEGDIVSCDVGVKIGGVYGDSAATFPVGQISQEAATLLRVTKEALHRGIAQARPGKRLGDVGHAIDRHVSEHGYSVVRDMVGHGVGLSLHEEPQIPNYGRQGTGIVLQEGMTLAIEPMVNLGGPDIEALDDRWTIVTCDRSLSAHFEHTVAVTRSGPVILTQGD